MRTLLRRFDNYVLRLMNSTIKNRFFDFFFPRFTNLGGGKFIAIALLISFFLVKRDYAKYFVIELGFLQMLTGMVVHTVKFLAKRVRPYNLLENLNTFDIFLWDYSFPSGHTAAAVSFCLMISYYYPNATLLAGIYALLMGGSRMYLGVHFPTDVIAGGLTGYLVTFLGHNYLSPVVLEKLGKILI